MTDNAAESLVEQMLVLRCQNGDAAAFADLVARYHRRLRYFLEKMLYAPDRVDDVLQDLWLDVFGSIRKLHDPSAFAAWLYRLARDRAYRDLRGRLSRPPTTDVDEIPEREAAANDDDFSPDDAEQIHHALNKLTVEHREVLLLRFVEDMNYQQIAAVVGCEIGTVRSRIHYAKLQLKELITRQEHSDERKQTRRPASPTRR